MDFKVSDSGNRIDYCPLWRNAFSVIESWSRSI